MANKPAEFPVFSPLDPMTLQNMMAKFPQYLQNIASVLNINNPDDLEVSQEALFDIFTRVEQRRIYFHVFHNGLQMGELNEGSLFCFWILKLAPFRHRIYRNDSVNAKIALCLFINCLKYYANKNKLNTNLTQHIIEDMYYAFIYRDLSKESIMALAESLIY
jgi:hypothetical protein